MEIPKEIILQMADDPGIKAFFGLIGYMKKRNN